MREVRYQHPEPGKTMPVPHNLKKYEEAVDTALRTPEGKFYLIQACADLGDKWAHDYLTEENYYTEIITETKVIHRPSGLVVSHSSERANYESF